VSKNLRDWVGSDVRRIKHKSLKWLSEQNFFRDPSRPIFSESNYIFAPADGIILYQRAVDPTQCILDIKGQPYSVRSAIQDPLFSKACLVIGIFMTMYDVHTNRMPYAGFLSYQQLEPATTLNYPMLDIERNLLNELTINYDHAEYLHFNQRVLNSVYAPQLRQHYFILQIADYDVDCIVPFNLNQNVPVVQNQRFSQIRFGSQVDLILPLHERNTFETVQETMVHVEAGMDPLVRIVRT